MAAKAAHLMNLADNGGIGEHESVKLFPNANTWRSRLCFSAGSRSEVKCEARIL